MFNFRDSKLVAMAGCAFVLLLGGCGGGGGGGSTTTTAVATTTPPASTPTVTASTFQTVTIPAPSLSDNLVGQSTSRQITVYLPQAYFASTATRLPVVYFLPGFGDSSMLGVAVTDLDNAFKANQAAIVVTVSGVSNFDGSFFVDSSATGKWAEYVHKDVVNYVDANFRTLAKRESRGVAGHSMGGFGALDLAMRHSEVFGSVFSLAPGLVGANGIVDTQLFDSETHIRSFIASMASIKDLAALKRNTSNYFDIAYGLAFAPTTTAPYFEYPYTIVGNTLVRDDAILAKWEAGFGNVRSEITSFKTSLQSLNGIQLDCASNDEYQWITRGCNYYDAELTAAGVAHTYTVHTGRHQDRLSDRIVNVMLPFFAQRLASK